MRLADKWVCDTAASHHMTANKQYFATYKRFSVPVNIPLADKGMILACGSGRPNIEMLIEEVVPRVLGRHVVHSQYWKKPVLGRECGRTWDSSHHKTSTGNVSM